MMPLDRGGHGAKRRAYATRTPIIRQKSIIRQKPIIRHKSILRVKSITREKAITIGKLLEYYFWGLCRLWITFCPNNILTRGWGYSVYEVLSTPNTRRTQYLTHPEFQKIKMFTKRVAVARKST